MSLVPGAYREDVVVDALVGVARPIILARYTLDSCIPSTRIAIAALARFGVEAEPFACQVVAYNRRYAERLAANLVPLDDPEAFSITVGILDPQTDHRRKVSGHVVGLTSNYVIDLSIDQASRPERGVVLEACAFPRLPTFTRLPTAIADDEHGGGLIYSPMPGERPWLEPQRDGMRQIKEPAVDEVIDAMSTMLR